MTDDEKQETYQKFKKTVNMTSSQIDAFLKTENSKKVGQKPEDGGESVGHQSGRRIITILCKYKAKLTDEDYTHMKKVIGYVARHLAQGGPDKDKETSNWRYSLMNWGHDPLKK